MIATFWLDDRGIPTGPEFATLGKAKALADMEEMEYCADEEVSGLVGGLSHKQHHTDIVRFKVKGHS